ncbi:MAG TPA: ADOP family duplicated permease [Rudaea sp.]|nr:ADOP family duplicated permease [Rudaea sp.]
MHWIRDCSLALRLLIGRRGFSILAMLSLALGFGAAIAILSVADAVLVRALPYPDAQQLIAVREIDGNGKSMTLADLNYRDLRDGLHGFASIAQYGGGIDLIVSGNRSTRGDVRAVSAEFFDVLGVAPALGRRFGSDSGADAHVAVISHALWRELFGAEPDLSKLHVDTFGEKLQVIGVMPERFEFPARTNLWFPRALFPAETSRTAHNWNAVARVEAGADLGQMRADALALGQRLKQQFGKDVDAAGFTLTPLRDMLVGRVQNALWALSCGAAFLLLIASVNVTNLFLALALSRRKESAVRTALGAPRLRLARQSVLESALLTAAAFALGLLFAQVCLQILVGLAGDSLPRADEVGFDARVVGAVLALAAALALLLGLLPYWRGGAEANALAEQGRATTLGHHGVRLRAALLIAQTTLTVLLLIGAGLLGRSFLQLLRVDPGFRPQGAVALDLSLPQPADAAGARAAAARYSELMRRFAVLPGVREVGGVNALPLTDTGWNGAFWDAAVVPKLDDLAHLPPHLGYAEYRVASAGYFQAIGIPLQRGRLFDDRDGVDAPHVALISAALARSVWPDRDPIGQKLQYGNMDGDMRPLTVIGIVGDVHDYGLDRDVRGTVYLDIDQRSKAASNFSVVVRSDAKPDAMIAGLRAELARSEPDLPVAFHTLPQLYASSLDNRRFSLSLFGLFAAVALGLALSGVYGLMAYAVSERRAEFSLRIALGSTQGRVLRFVLGQGLRLTLLGLALGCAAAFAASRLLQSLLFGVSVTDPLTYLAVAALLLVASLAACGVPAWRAARSDPRASLG